MSTARDLKNRFLSTKYIADYNSASDKSSMPNPTEVKIRVYSSQSTHKTLSSFRQGSMIHILDDEYNSDIFIDAFYTHTSTSPSYQILASLDIARRQVSIEGFELMNRSLRLAAWLQDRISADVKVSAIFKTLTTRDIFPEAEERSNETMHDYKLLKDVINFQSRGFRLDPTRITLDVSRTGLTGGQFRKLLINKYNIQVNKTSRHTVLFIINIGVNEDSVKYLYQTLAEIADHFTTVSFNMRNQLGEVSEASLPQDRRYHDRYLPFSTPGTSSEIVNIRLAYFDAYSNQNVEYIELSKEILSRSQAGATWVSASFVTPYPPGFPLLVPGQVITQETLQYLSSIINDEIHGFEPEKGLKVFTNTFLTEN